MTLRAVTLSLALLAVAVSPAFGQDPPPPKPPAQLFKDARDLISSGNYELAAEKLELFLLAVPKDDPKADALVLDVEKQFGGAAFARLRNVLKWSDNKAENAKAVAIVEAVLKRQQLASDRTFKNPARIADLIRRLESYRAERLYAEQQLRLAGVAAMPQLIKAFRATNKPELQASITALFTTMPVETVPTLVATLDGFTDAERVLVIGALTAREDVLQLPKSPETDFVPFLWYQASAPGGTPSVLRSTSVKTLERLFGPSATRTRAEAALTALAEPLAAGKATYLGQDPMTAGQVRVWTYDTAQLQLKSADVPRPVADEYYGLKYLRWALARNPNFGPAQRLFTAFATERAVVRAKFGDLSTSEPAVYRLLAAAPTELLTELLETALAESRTALALGMTQALGDRAQKDNSTAESQSPLVRALAYDDPRVKFAAAVALARQPGPPTHGKSACVVEILRQALAADADGSGAGTLGRALIADTDPVRGEGLAQMFRDAGFAAERYATGRQLVARLSKASDYDLIVVDRHVAAPLLSDTLTQVTADTNAARRPVFVVASTDNPKPPPLEVLLLRLSNIVAAADDGMLPPAGSRGGDFTKIVIPPPYAFNPLKPDKDRDEARRERVLARDQGLIGISDAEMLAMSRKARENGKSAPLVDQRGLLDLRLARLERLVEAADLPINPDLASRLKLRLPQLVLAGMVAEFEATPATAPRTVERLARATRDLLTRPDLQAAAEVPDLNNLPRLLEQLDSKLTPDQKARLRLIQNRVQPGQLALPSNSTRDLALEATLAAQVKRLPSVRVLPEPFAAEYLKADIEQAIQNPAQQPRDPAERAESAVVAAQVLRRMAVGELPGYEVGPAEKELRAALRNDPTAAPAIDAVTRLPSKEAQEDLLAVALTADREPPLRLKAADGAIRHIQAFGKLAGEALGRQAGALAATEADLTLRGKLGVLAQLLTGKPGDYGDVLRSFPIRLSFPNAAQPPMPKNPPVKPPEEPKM